MIIAHLGGESPQQHGPLGACSTDRNAFAIRREPLGVAKRQQAAPALLAQGVVL